jgi:hypothetical protein
MTHIQCVIIITKSSLYEVEGSNKMEVCCQNRDRGVIFGSLQEEASGEGLVQDREVLAKTGKVIEAAEIIRMRHMDTVEQTEQMMTMERNIAVP